MPRTLTARLAEATEGGPLPAARLGAFVDEVRRRARTPSSTARRSRARRSPPRSTRCCARRAGRRWRALLNLQAAPGSTVDAAGVRAAIAGVPGVQLVVDQARARRALCPLPAPGRMQAALGAVAVVALLAPLPALRAPPGGGAAAGRCCQLVVLAVLRRAVPLGILHLVGLLLAVAVGSNYALFFDQLRAAEPVDEDTLASLMLANLTTVVSFALIAISQIPALSAIGARGRAGRLALPGVLGELPRPAGARRRAMGKSSHDARPPTSRPVPRCMPPAGAAVLLAPAVPGPGRSARSAPIMVLTGGGLWPRRAGSAPTGPACPRPRRRGGRSRSPSTTGPTRRSRRRCSTCSMRTARATFFCIAERVLAILPWPRDRARGHSIQNHSDAIATRSPCSGRAASRPRSRARRRGSPTSRRAPRCFRAPAGLRNPLLAPVLHRMGLALVSWTRRGFDTAGASRRPCWRASATAWRPATSCCCTTATPRAPARARRWCWRCCRRCSRASRADGLRAVTLAEALPVPRRTRPTRLRRRRDDHARRRHGRRWSSGERPYRKAGNFAWHFARGKLGRDPVFRASSSAA